MAGTLPASTPCGSETCPRRVPKAPSSQPRTWPGKADKATLELLANNRRLEGEQFAAASDDVLEALYTWYQDGWVELG